MEEHLLYSCTCAPREDGTAKLLALRKNMDGRIFNSEGKRVANIRSNEVFDLSGTKIYDIRGQKIYKLSGELVGHFSSAAGDQRLDKFTDRLFPQA